MASGLCGCLESPSPASSPQMRYVEQGRSSRLPCGGMNTGKQRPRAIMCLESGSRLLLGSSLVSCPPRRDQEEKKENRFQGRTTTSSCRCWLDQCDQNHHH